MKAAINLIIRFVGVLVALLGISNFLPIFTGTRLVEGILSITFMVVCVYIGGMMAFSRTRFKVR